MPVPLVTVASGSQTRARTVGMLLLVGAVEKQPGPKGARVTARVANRSAKVGTKVILTPSDYRPKQTRPGSVERINAEGHGPTSITGGWSSCALRTQPSPSSG
jgi:hypothetical protein